MMTPSHPNYQNVQKKAKEFECYPEDTRTDFSRSELARLSKKVLLPNVTERAHEYEVKTAPEPSRKEIQTQPEAQFSTLKRVQRDSRSLDSSDICTATELQPFRARSNSAESWTTAIGDKANTEPIAVKRRNKKIGKDDRSRRPESYLKATKGEQTSFGSDLSDYDEVSSQALRNRYRKWHPSPFHGDIEQLRKLFEDAASYKGGSGSGNSSTSSLDREKFSLTVPAQQKFKTTDAAVIREGLVNCKILEIDGKRAADRSWKQVTMILKGFKLFLCKDRHHQSPLGTSDVALDQSLAPGVDMRTSAVRVPDDYTKRKNVLRVSTVKPCRSEFLIQAESGEEFADWVKTLQQQVAISTEAELDHHSSSRQQAVPQTQPATTSIQVQGSHLSPQTTKNSKFISSNRSRSPTGQSPVSKTRKPSSQLENNQTSTTSPKSKTWRGRVAKQFKKFNPSGTNSPLSPTAPEVSTFGVPIEHCITSSTNNYLPRFVEVCTEIIDEKGLEVIGIYRVPGNNASITALTEEINRNFEEVPLEDQKWNDLHVVSSLLKSFLRKMPDSLVTSALYPQFIKADKIEDQKQRLEELRRLVRSLPKHNYHTLRHVILHLKRVADNSQFNRMEAKNLAIVFGPTIVRPESESMESMVTNMNNQCKIVETLIANAEWFFPEAGDGEAIVPQVPLAVPDSCDEFETNNQALLNNISKYEALKDQKEKNGALLTSLFTAAHRKVMRKPSRSHNTQESNRDEPTTPIGQKTFVSFMNQTGSEKTDYNQKDIQNPSHAMTEQQTQQQPQPEINKPMTEKNPWFNYKTDQSDFSRRVEIFKQETEAMLQRPRMTEISIPNISSGPLSSSIGNVNTNPTGSSLKPQADFLLSKTHSATNVFTRPLSNNKNSIEPNDVGRYSYNESSGASDTKLYNHYGMRRGSSVENVNSSNLDLNANNGGLKKVKYETENGNQRKSSLDSLHKIPTTDDESLLTTITKLLDQKLKEDQSDQSPLKTVMVMLEEESKNRSRPQETQYKDPSLHRSQYTTLPNQKFKSDLKENKDEAEKEQDTKEDVPDNERHILITNNKIHPGGVPLMTKVRRNESLKRTDSLTKTEKTESNINKKRELLQAGRRLGSTKNKRKNGTPDRSIKRRHTVGGTKDPDKVTYFLDNNNKENNRTSSPDLSSVRREKFLLEINLISAENMVVAPRRHLIGGNRPQSFPVPLESHV
ncbi:hypothetical protein ABEB36_007096 [Hypothenemus hampei]|uniref:Rho GTPase activating protein 21 n=1 Tax=Hypothenemus hampei TaxID=57062 RepID=A0ABD1EWR6_HYPHA